MLKKVQRSKPLKLIQMRPQHFKDFHTIAQQVQYQRIPFTKVKCLLFEQKEPKIVKYKKHLSDDWNVENVIERKPTRSAVTEVLFKVPDPAVAKGAAALTQAKKDDIKAMLKFMPPADKGLSSVEWGVYTLSASKAIFRARTYNCNLFSPVVIMRLGIDEAGHTKAFDYPVAEHWGESQRTKRSLVGYSCRMS